jgi:hypothetical protein
MKDLTGLRERLRGLGIKLLMRPESGRGDGPRLAITAPPGALTPEIRAELATHKAELLATLGVGQAFEPDSVRPDPPPAGKPDPLPPDRSWRRIVARWPVDWRRRWGARANELADGGEPWDRSEWLAFRETARDLAAAEARGEVPAQPYPDRRACDSFSDPEAITAIHLPFEDPNLKDPGHWRYFAPWRMGRRAGSGATTSS